MTNTDRRARRHRAKELAVFIREFIGALRAHGRDADPLIALDQRNTVKRMNPLVAEHAVPYLRIEVGGADRARLALRCDCTGEPFADRERELADAPLLQTRRGAPSQPALLDQQDRRR